MLTQNLKGIVINLDNINSGAEIPIKNLFVTKEEVNLKKENKFSFEEVVVNDSSASICYTQHKNKLLCSVYGPRETRFRDKAKGDESIVEIYTKFNFEINKESKKYFFDDKIYIFIILEQKRLNGIIQNFCESIIFLDAYPRCQINICLNVVTINNEHMVNIYLFFNFLIK
jgi:ribonuclease PH